MPQSPYQIYHPTASPTSPKRKAQSLTPSARALAQAGVFLASGDAVADIIGFSRGAAEARDFANKLKEKYPCIKIRWIGIFDTVVSSAGYNEGIPAGTGSVLHLTAGGERRKRTFSLTSINAGLGLPNPNPNYREQEIPGAVHSDVGGGYPTNRGLANGALQRMWQDGVSHGVPFAPLPADYSDTNGTPHDSRWINDRAIELFTGQRQRKIHYSP